MSRSSFDPWAMGWHRKADIRCRLHQLAGAIGLSRSVQDGLDPPTRHMRTILPHPEEFPFLGSPRGTADTAQPVQADKTLSVSVQPLGLPYEWRDGAGRMWSWSSVDGLYVSASSTPVPAPTADSSTSTPTPSYVSRRSIADSSESR